MKFKKKIAIRVVVFGLLVLAGLGIAKLSGHPVMQCYFVRWTELEEIAPKVFIDPNMPEDKREFLLVSIEEAKDRISGLYGEYTAAPVIIAGHTMEVMERFGGNTYNQVGRTYLTALGSYIIFGPDGISDTDVIAHEIGHAELAQRIGQKAANQLPDWFEEGLALQFDNRFTEEDWEKRTSNGINAPNLEEISVITHDDWLGYATAKHEVRRWLDAAGQDGLLSLLQSIRNGADFYQAYQSIESDSGGAVPDSAAIPSTTPPLPSLTPTPTLEDSLTSLQTITAENAAQVEELVRFQIPGFNFIRETCSVAFSPDGRYLAAACMSKSIPIWEIPSGELLHALEGSQIGVGVTFSPDSATLVSTGQGTKITFWDVQSGEQVERIMTAPAYLNIPVFSADGLMLAVGSFTGKAVVFDVTTKDLISSFEEHASRVNSVDFSGVDNRVVSGGGDNLARVWDAETGEELLTLSGANYFIEDVEFSPNGEFIVGTSDDSIIRIWNAADGALIQEMRGHTGPVNGIAYSPDGMLVASCGNDGTLRIWNSQTGEQLVRLAGHTDYAIRPAFHPDGNLIATIGWDGNLILWGIPND